jgi:anti-anti-sigma factor
VALVQCEQDGRRHTTIVCPTLLFGTLIVVPYQNNEDAVKRQMAFEIEQRDDICIVHISGRLAVGVDNDLLILRAREIKNLGCHKIVADIVKLTAIGSSGISFFVDLYTSTSKYDDGCFVLAGPSPRVLEVLALTGLTGIMPMALDLAGGLAFCTRKEGKKVGRAEGD